MRSTLIVLLLSMTIRPQLFGQEQRVSPLVLWFRYTKIETKIELHPYVSTTCLAVFPDGKFHMESGSGLRSSIPDVFEEKLPDETVQALFLLLERRDLKDLRTAEHPRSLIHQGEVVQAVIARGEVFQRLQFPVSESSETQRPSPVPEAFEPLLGWFQAATKDITARKLRPIKGGKSANCYFPRP